MEEKTVMHWLQDEYEAFINAQMQGRSPADIEFLGINLQNCCDARPVFKCYFATGESLRTQNALLADFSRRDMIRALNRISDTAFPGRTRYEIGLKNRSNTNMRWLGRWIEDAFPVSDRQEREIRSMGELTCCDLPEYRHSALYFLGFIANDDRPMPLSAIKLHYLLRKCEDPDNIGMNYQVDNVERLQFLRKSGIAPLGVLADAVGKLLESTEGIELWMAAMDYFLQGTSKYKIYIKTVGGDLLEPIRRLLTDRKLEHLVCQLDACEKCLMTPPDRRLYGAAFCVTPEEDWSLNMYYTLEASRSDNVVGEAD